jgi:hypothetical protein
VVYDPDSGTFSDTPFGNTGNPLQDAFGIPVDDADDGIEDGRTAFVVPAGDVPVGTVGRISYDRGDNELISGPTELDGDHVPWSPGGNRRERDVGKELGSRQRTHTGDRNIRGAARQHGVGAETGGSGGSGEKALAGSIDAAGKRLAERETRVSDTGGLDPRLAKYLQAAAVGKTDHFEAGPKGPGTTEQTLARKPEQGGPPTFRRGEFVAEVYGCKMNVAGDWLVQFKIPHRYTEFVVGLSTVAGMMLTFQCEVEDMSQSA